MSIPSLLSTQHGLAQQRSRQLCKPITVGQEILGQARLFPARLRLPVVAPARMRPQRHQDRFGTPAGLQTEQRAVIEHQVELDIAAAAEGLELTDRKSVV